MDEDNGLFVRVLQGHFGISVDGMRSKHIISAAIQHNIANTITTEEYTTADGSEIYPTPESGTDGNDCDNTNQQISCSILKDDQEEPSIEIDAQEEKESRDTLMDIKIIPDAISATLINNSSNKSARNKRSKSLNYVIPKVRLTAASHATICEKRRSTLPETNSIPSMPIPKLMPLLRPLSQESNIHTVTSRDNFISSNQESHKEMNHVLKATTILKVMENAGNKDYTAIQSKCKTTIVDNPIGNNENIENNVENSLQTKNIEKSLLCDEDIVNYSPTTSSNTSSKISNEKQSVVYCESPLTDVNSFSSTLNMVSTYNMLKWKERIGVARGTQLRFHLNEFNLIEIYEHCSPRDQIHVAYENPIYDREAIKPKLGSNGIAEKDPPYLCRSCNCHGAADDFLAPGFCSLRCLKRSGRKRRRQSLTPSKHHHSLSPQKEEQLSTNNNHPEIQPYFKWSTYLHGIKRNMAAPIDHFLNPFPTGPNPFALSMKLEAIDPENCSLFCVCSVVEIRGYRLKLSFDGYDSMYDFWVNADSMDIFPPGWCERTDRILQPPRQYEGKLFNWSRYLATTKAIGAPREIFTHLNSPMLPFRNGFQEGMHLEAEDLNDTGKLCVAMVADVLDDRIRVHFNGWDCCYDYWVDINSPYIHPCGWHEGRQQLIVPPEFENYSFTWSEYIKQRNTGIAAPAQLFEAREPIDFKAGMKMEVVDPRTPSLIRPATVIARKGHRIKLHFDGWAPEYCFWIEDDSPDLHPINWCEVTHHYLEPPPGYNNLSFESKTKCGIADCRGMGNARCFNLSTHTTRDCCPYTLDNWRIKVEKPPRVNINDVVMRKSSLIQPLSNSKPSPSPAAAATATTVQKTYKTSQITKQMQMLNILETASSAHDPMRITRLSQHENEIVTATSCATSCANNIETTNEQPDYLLNIIPKEEVLPTNNDFTTDSEISNELPPEINIAKTFLLDYGPRLQQNYNIWQKNLNVNENLFKSNPLEWTTADVAAFVESIGCANIAQLMESEDIDGMALLLLQQSDLTDLLGIRLGPAVKLFAHIVNLRTIVYCKYNNAKMNIKDKNEQR